MKTKVEKRLEQIEKRLKELELILQQISDLQTIYYLPAHTITRTFSNGVLRSETR